MEEELTRLLTRFGAQFDQQGNLRRFENTSEDTPAPSLDQFIRSLNVQDPMRLNF